MPATASNATFSAPDFGRGLRATWLPVSSYDPNAAVFPGVELPTSMPLTIVSPRPISERTGRLHTPWDKWLTGTAWGGKGGMHVGVMFGVPPFRLEVSGDLNSGDFTIDNDLMTITKTFTAAGTYNLKLTVIDSVFAYTSVDISLIVYANDDGGIASHFRVIDFDAGSNGSGTLTSPYNAWSSFWGTDWNVSISPTIIALMDGTATVSSLTLTNEPSSQVWSLGTNRPRCLIGLDGSDVTFDISATGAAKRLNCHTAGDTDMWLKGFTLSGVRAAQNSMVRQTNFDSRWHMLDLVFENALIDDTANTNECCIGSDGNTYLKRWSVFKGITFDNITGTNLASNAGCLILFEVSDVLYADITMTNIGVGNARLSWGVRFKHEADRCEIRNVTHIQLGYDPFASNYASIAIPTNTAGAGTYTDTVVRHCCVMHSGHGLYSGFDTPQVYTNLFVLNNTFRCSIVGFNPTAASTGYFSKNIVENGATSPGFETTDVDLTPADGHAAVFEDNLHGASGTLISDTGIPLLAANNGYGHSIAYLAA